MSARPISNIHGKAGSRKVSRQVVLPFRKSLEISYKSLRVRLFRSLLTVGSLVLAVSFLAYVLVNTNLAEGMLATGDQAAIQTLTQAGFDVDQSTRTVSATPKQRWIIVLSLLVCAVGIINAQLMSVTERFREIGILKCLGALDSMILRIFLLEAAMMGLAGAAAGALTGFGFAMLAGLLRFGFAGWCCLSWSGVLISLAISLGVGVGLSLIGVLYPSILASRMQPVAAMKAEH